MHFWVARYGRMFSMRLLSVLESSGSFRLTLFYNFLFFLPLHLPPAGDDLRFLIIHDMQRDSLDRRGSNGGDRWPLVCVSATVSERRVWDLHPLSQKGVFQKRVPLRSGLLPKELSTAVWDKLADG